MASSRFTGNGFSNPLNPIGLHAENQYRELIPMGNDFQPFNSETKVFRVGAGALLGETTELLGKEMAEELLEELTEAGGKAGAELVAKMMAEGATKEVAEAAGEQLSKQIIEIGQRAAINAIEVAGKSAGEALEAGIKAGAREAGEELGKELSEQGIKNATEQLAKNPRINPYVGRAMNIGGAILGMGVALNIVGLDGAGGKWIESMTGMDCDQKAIEAGYVGGTDEYTESVEKCQEAAANKLAFLGTAAIVAVGLVVFMVIK